MIQIKVELLAGQISIEEIRKVADVYEKLFESSHNKH
tara:strand:- start:137 stop:247 length:111 start_codon:yes stop_codon:yes gene_type:complete